MSAFADSLAQAQHVVAARAAEVLPGGGALGAAMAHALHGGKTFRGFLVLETARISGVSAACAVDAALAIEAVHAYSLVHDDLPCMDDDDLRRGQPTVHKKWDEATAVLAGDALLTFAFELLADAKFGAAIAPLVLSLAKAAGASGMVGGQMMDIAAETAATPLTLVQITELQRLKTGQLISWAATAGPLMAGADTAPLQEYATAVGLAFQIADDLLDVQGHAGTVGKAVGKDAAAGKATFVTLLGQDGAAARAGALVDEACGALRCYGAEAATLKQAARFVIARNK